ncbi:MAG: glycosyltransferase [bacterium]
MATRNGSRFVSEAVSSVLKQTYGNFELIVVDDASTDKAVDIVAGFSDQRIRIVRNERRLGLTKSLNRGIRLARGEYIARIDDDDVWVDKDKLVKQVLYMQENDNIGVCGVQNIVIDADGRELYRLYYETENKTIRRHMMERNQFPHSSVLIRKSALDRVGLYDEQYCYAQDFELWLRIGLKYQLANLPDVYIQQRVNPRGVTSKKNMRQFLSFLKIAYQYRNKYPGFWFNLPVYLRELLVNLLPKTTFYHLSAWHRR